MPDFKPDTSMKERNRLYNHQWYLANKERNHDRVRRWRSNNRERSNELSREWRAKNPDKHAAILARRDKSRLYAAMKRWRIKHKEKAATYDRIYGSLRRAKENGAKGRFYMMDISSLLIDQNFECVYCFRDIREAFHLDHKVPLCRGGDNSRENIQALCPSCNTRKRHRTSEEFLAVMENQNARL